MSAWNYDDPPEPPEMPACPSCGFESEVEEIGCSAACGDPIPMLCLDCGCVWNEPMPAVPEPVAFVDPQSTRFAPVAAAAPECPHGRAWGSCDACDALSDFAHDCAREGKR